MNWKETLFVMIATLFAIEILSQLLSPPKDLYFTRFEERTGYWPKQLNRVYDYDSIGEYRDYNQLLIYKMADPLFDEYVATAWSPLPLPEEIHSHYQMQTDFDPMIEKMIEDQEGFWTANLPEQGNEWICVYHLQDELLYIRTWN